MFIPISSQRVAIGYLLVMALFAVLPAQASEKDELASAQRLLVQVLATLERARIAELQDDPFGHGRFHFDYQRVNADLKTINSGINLYLQPSRAQPRLGDFVVGNYRRDRP